MVRWLHISDLHLGDDDSFTSRMRKQLPEILREMGNFDYIFLTGDIRSANVMPNNFTQSMANYLEEICDACGLSTSNLFIVPGNHDVNRDLDCRHDAIKRVSFGREGYYNPRKGKIKDEDLTVIWNGQEEKKVVGLILQENNVRLWLAGHEHDHVLQRIGYLDMLQAGELRYEGNASASFLIVEYDSDTFQCEGWAQYPYIDMDSDQKDVYRFALKPYNERKVSSLLLKARKANERYLNVLADYLDVRIIPKLHADDTIEALPDLL